MKNKRLNREEVILIVIDYQERLVPAMMNKEETIATAAKLIKGFSIMELPIMIVQQYPKGLGETVSEIKSAAENGMIIDKQTFSAWKDENFVSEFKKQNKKIVVVIGIEAHICEQETVLDLLDEGYTIYVAQDCISSRKENDKLVSVERMRQNGANITTYESILFELLGSNKAPEFKQISALVK